MATTRINAEGLLEIYHPETDSWVSGIALLQILNGFDVDLIGDGATTLTNLLTQSTEIAANTNNATDLTDLRTRLGDLQGLVGALNATAPTTDSGGSSVNGRLIRALQHLTDILNAVTPIGTKVDQMKASIDAQTSATTPKIINLSVGTSAEALVTFPADTKKISVKCRADSGDYVCPLRYAWETGIVVTGTGIGASNGYDVIPGRGALVEEGINIGRTLYLLATGSQNAPVAVTYWT